MHDGQAGSHRLHALICDMDGVLTDTAGLHARAWKTLFDEVLAAQVGDGPFMPFDADTDYRRYVDGKPREAGLRDFLAARGITLPAGTPDDPPSATTLTGLAKRKNALFLRLLDAGIAPYPDAVRLLDAATARGLALAVISASRNAPRVLQAAGLTARFAVRIDGNVAQQRGLPGKPAPDVLVAAATALDVAPQEAAVIEDAIAGVQAAHAGGFGCIVGVDRDGTRGEELRAAGATRLVRSLDALLLPPSVT